MLTDCLKESLELAICAFKVEQMRQVEWTDGL